MTVTSIKATTEATDHLLKAVIALLSVKDPGFLKQLDQVFALADAHGSPISRMPPEAWAEIRREMLIISEFVHGDAPEEAPPSLARIKRAH